MDFPEDIQKRLMEVLQADDTIVFTMDETGKYLSLLGGTNRDLYSDGSRLIGKTYYDVLKKEKADYFQSLIDRVIETGGHLEAEYELVTSDFLDTPADGPQNIQKFHASLFPFQRNEEEDTSQVIWVIRNITEKA